MTPLFVQILHMEREIIVNLTCCVCSINRHYLFIASGMGNLFGAFKGKRESTVIAGFLWKDSPIVLFDEKTSILDTIPEVSIQEVFDVLQDHRALVTGDRMNRFLLY